MSTYCYDLHMWFIKRNVWTQIVSSIGMYIKMIKSPFKCFYTKIMRGIQSSHNWKNATSINNKSWCANIHQYSHLTKNVAQGFSKQNHILINKEPNFNA